jgi:hypothetical protein
LEYGGSKLPQVVLVDKAGVISYIGNPKKLGNLKNALETLLKGEKLVVPADESAQESFAKPTYVEPEGKYSEALSLPQVKEEMKNLSLSLSALAKEDPIIKECKAGLLTDSLMTLRLSKIDPETGFISTKFMQVNSLAGPQESVGPVNTILKAFFHGFGGSF